MIPDIQLLIEEAGSTGSFLIHFDEIITSSIKQNLNFSDSHVHSTGPIPYHARLQNPADNGTRNDTAARHSGLPSTAVVPQQWPAPVGSPAAASQPCRCQRR